jgi:hypothetical protein
MWGCNRMAPIIFIVVVFFKEKIQKIEAELKLEHQRRFQLDRKFGL